MSNKKEPKNVENLPSGCTVQNPVTYAKYWATKNRYFTGIKLKI